ncbi:MAG: TlpA disulfide reductase family protein [Thermoflexales bacterium]
MNRFPTRLIALAAVAAFFGFGAAFLVLQTTNPASGPGLTVPPAPRLLREGQAAPEFALETLDGKTVRLANLRGKRVLINFWASWCAPCVVETPDLVAANRALREANRDIVFLGIATQDAPADVQRFTETRNVDYDILLDPKGVVGNAYGVFGLPATFFVDESGIVRRIVSGAITRERVLAEFQ